jgi:hypothetical protein
VDVGLFISHMGSFRDNADQVNDRLHAGHGGGQRLRFEGVASGKFDAREAGKRIFPLGMTNKNAYGVAQAGEFLDHLLSHKSSAAGNENHNDFLRPQMAG